MRNPIQPAFGGLPACPATCIVGKRTVRCQRELRDPLRPHERHEYKSRGVGYDITVTWREIIDKPPKPANTAKRRLCGLCRRYGHNRGKCALLPEGA